jgi:hypothetical protein
MTIESEHTSEPRLELKKLLGFSRVAGFAGDDDLLARALGASCNKAGAETPPASPLHKALAMTHNKIGETTGTP